MQIHGEEGQLDSTSWWEGWEGSNYSWPYVQSIYQQFTSLSHAEYIYPIPRHPKSCQLWCQARLQGSWGFPLVCPLVLFLLLPVMEASCHVNCPMEKPMWQGQQKRPPANSQWEPRPSTQQPMSTRILATATCVSFSPFRWDWGPDQHLGCNLQENLRQRYLLRTELCPPHSCVKAPTPNVPASGDKAYKEVVEVKWGYKVGALHPIGLVSL